MCEFKGIAIPGANRYQPGRRSPQIPTEPWINLLQYLAEEKLALVFPVLIGDVTATPLTTALFRINKYEQARYGPVEQDKVSEISAKKRSNCALSPNPAICDQ
jgi:hypothetical protein